MPRFIPQIKTDLTPGYAGLLGHNFDTVQESFNLELPPPLLERLQWDKDRAAEQETPVEFTFGGELFQIWLGASQGKKYVIEHDDFQIHFGSPKQSWPITVRYLAAGLWEHGIDALKERVMKCLLKECNPAVGEEDWDRPETWQRINRVDYAFDFHSPDFTREMMAGMVRQKVLAPSGVKLGVIGTSLRDETLQIGYCRPGLCIQVYDKGKEITDMSGKTWMYRVWEREGYYPPLEERGKDVWRVEVRFGKDYIKDRGILTLAQFRDALRELLAEALFSRRLTAPSATDDHRERWPLHPLWAAVYDASGRAGEYAPIGRQITLRRDAMADCLDKQITGSLRARATLGGDYDGQIKDHVGETCIEAVEEDPEHFQKVAKARERYRFLEDAK